MFKAALKREISISAQLALPAFRKPLACGLKRFWTLCWFHSAKIWIVAKKTRGDSARLLFKDNRNIVCWYQSVEQRLSNHHIVAEMNDNNLAILLQKIENFDWLCRAIYKLKHCNFLYFKMWKVKVELKGYQKIVVTNY